ncbi:MAG: AmmeMemoRadiSam system radical SAM enzyme [Acidobacteriia bacterium]|nr:AmmeMemoRadiSam system radical SAM enzyme [Terriglobia bacterium]
MDTANATRALCRSLLQGLHQEHESMDRGSDLGFSIPQSAITSPPPDRRTFLKATTLPCLAACAAACLHTSPAVALGAPSLPEDDARFRVEARFYEKLPGKNVRCKMCPRGCVVGDRQRGHCRVRENRGGTYYSLVHSRVCAAHIDPIEKKPFFHFHPGILAFSVATAGCNVNCKFCQNWEISQAMPEDLPARYMPPADVAALAKQNQCPAVAFTYSEPTVFNEFVTDAADAARAQGTKAVVVSNGFIQQEPLKRLCRHVDAIKIDLKAFSAKYYREVVNAELQPVLDTLVTTRKEAKWMEIVHLVVPTLNDSDTEFRDLARWIKTNLGTDVPIHFTRFHPLYLLKNLPPTPVETLERAKAIADAEGLQFTYIGNVPGHPAENTRCPKCRRLLIERAGFTITQNHIRKGKCEYCQHVIPGVWS